MLYLHVNIFIMRRFLINSKTVRDRKRKRRYNIGGPYAPYYNEQDIMTPQSAGTYTPQYDSSKNIPDYSNIVNSNNNTSSASSQNNGKSALVLFLL